MNRLKCLIILCISSLLIVFCAVSVMAASVKNASVTVYNSGRALVKEARSVTLPKGLASVVIKDVPSTLDPTSVRATAKGMAVYDLQYSFLPITTDNILNRYLGKELTVIMPDPSDVDAKILRKATLVSNVDRPIFLVGNEVYVGNYEALLFPDLPKDLEREPTLRLSTDTKSAGKRDVVLSYLMGGLTWRADYALTVTGKGDSASIDAWATVNNTSQGSFTNASLKLVAGDVKQSGSNRVSYAKAAAPMMEADMVSSGSQPREEQFSEYHVYDVKRRVTLAEASTKQLSLFSASKVGVKQELVSLFHGGNGQRNGKVKQSVAVSLSFANTDKNGLGRPMPSGLVRVFMPTSDGSQLLAGESRIGHVGKGGEVKLALGQSFDVSVERSQTNFKKLGKRSYEMSWRISIINGKADAQSLTLKDMYPGQWNVTKADRKFTKPDAGSLEFSLSVPPSKNGQPMTIDYTVQVTY